MLTELGRFFFVLGLSVALVSYIVAGILMYSGSPVPDVLLAGSGLLSALSGRLSLSSAVALVGTVTAGVLTMLSYFWAIFRGGGQVSMDIGKLMAISSYLVLYSVAADGVSIALRGMLPMYFYMVPPIAGLGAALANTVFVVALIALGYYLLVRVFGVPPE